MDIRDLKTEKGRRYWENLERLMGMKLPPPKSEPGDIVAKLQDHPVLQSRDEELDSEPVA